MNKKSAPVFRWGRFFLALWTLLDLVQDFLNEVFGFVFGEVDSVDDESWLEEHGSILALMSCAPEGVFPD